MKIRVLALLAATAALFGLEDVLPQQTASVAISMIVTPQYGLVVELYDEDGNLVTRSDSAVPPAAVTLRSPDGLRTGVYIPATHLASPATIRIFIAGTLAKRQSVERADAKARAMGVSPIRGTRAIEFCAPAELAVRPGICMCFPDDLEESVTAHLAIFWLDESEEAWVRLPHCEVDHAECTVSADQASFAVFRVMAQAATDLRRLMVLPNPFVPKLAAGGHLRFLNLTPEATIRIYDIEGRLVWKTDLNDSGGSAVWYGIDTAGQAVASGIYPYVVTAPTGNRIRGKITLIR
jgi:hypothetical protein